MQDRARVCGHQVESAFTAEPFILPVEIKTIARKQRRFDDAEASVHDLRPIQNEPRLFAEIEHSFIDKPQQANVPERQFFVPPLLGGGREANKDAIARRRRQSLLNYLCAQPSLDRSKATPHDEVSNHLIRKKRKQRSAKIYGQLDRARQVDQ